jgi:hypothetical protein
MTVEIFDYVWKCDLELRHEAILIHIDSEMQADLVAPIDSTMKLSRVHLVDVALLKLDPNAIMVYPTSVIHLEWDMVALAPDWWVFVAYQLGRWVESDNHDLTHSTIKDWHICCNGIFEDPESSLIV